MPCLLPPLALGNRGGGHEAPAALGRRPWGSAVATGRGEERGGHREPAPHLNLGRGAARRWRHEGRRVAGGGAVERVRGQGVGEEGEEEERVRFPDLARAGV